MGDPIGIKRIIKIHYEQLRVHKFENLNQVDLFLERHKLPAVLFVKTNNQKRPVSIKQSQLLIILKTEAMILFQNTKAEITIPTS